MRYILALLVLLLPLSAYADNHVETILEIKETIKAPVYDTILDKETKDAIYFLENSKLISKEDRIYIRFFSTYAIENPADRQKAVLTCSFVLHSLIGPANDEEDNIGGYYPLAKIEVDPTTKEQKFVAYRKVPGSDTLWWIDLRDYNFSINAWENSASIEPYFVKPIVSDRLNDLIRILSGNAIVRMDWFIYHATDITAETDANRKIKIYDELLYSQVTAPKTVNEFIKAWGINSKDEQRLLGNEYAVLVTKSKNVARHNRMLFGYRSPTGWLYQTYDVKNQEGLRDYVDSLPLFKGKPPTVFDGGEMFATNALKMQVYTLYNDKEQLVDEADPKLARHLTDMLGDPRVRTAFSCIDCHAAGPIPPENTIKEYIDKYGIAKVPYKVDQLRIRRTYLSEKFEDAAKDDQISFARALLKVNGLTPEENARFYLELVTRYNQPLTLKDVARECGVTEEIILSKSKEGLQDFNYKIPGRLAVLLTTNEAIPRDTWDSPGADGIPGIFQQIMLMIYGVTTVTETTTARIAVQYVVNNTCHIQHGPRVIAELPRGTVIPDTAIQNRNIDATGIAWVYIKHSGVDGWIQERFLTKR